MSNVLITPGKKQKALTYIRAIRNKNKREYAQNFLAWAENNFDGEDPYDFCKLSLIAGQAVRMKMTKILAPAKN